MPPTPSPLTLEAQAREKIDSLLAVAGWVLQNRADFDRTMGLGVASANS